jgi:hypothetical protein
VGSLRAADREAEDALRSTTKKKLNGYLADEAMLVLCAYSLASCRTGDILDVARSHPSAVMKRNGEWEVR